MTTIIYRIVAPVGDEDGGMKREGVLSTGVLYIILLGGINYMIA